MVRVGRIELPFQPWQGRVLPLNYTRVADHSESFRAFMLQNSPNDIGHYSQSSSAQPEIYLISLPLLIRNIIPKTQDFAIPIYWWYKEVGSSSYFNHLIIEAMVKDINGDRWIPGKGEVAIMPLSGVPSLSFSGILSYFKGKEWTKEGWTPASGKKLLETWISLFGKSVTADCPVIAFDSKKKLLLAKRVQDRVIIEEISEIPKGAWILFFKKTLPLSLQGVIRTTSRV